MSKLPWSCAVEGVPASVQGSTVKRDGWKAKVLQAAREAWTVEPTDLNVQVGITFFYLSSPPDVDNILKYTIDGLVGCVILDDSRVTDVRGSLRSIKHNYTLAGQDILIASALAKGEPFVQIKVHESPNLLELP